MANIFVSELRRMAILLYVKLILTRSLNVHIPRVPVALFGDTLRAPMRPDPELRIPKPIRATIGLQRLPKRKERTAWNFSLKELRVPQRMSHARQRDHRKSALEE